MVEPSKQEMAQQRMAAEIAATNQRGFAVGDINSDERGTGARANGGKARMDLIPLYLTLRASGGRLLQGAHVVVTAHHQNVLKHVAQFELGDSFRLQQAVNLLTAADLREAAHVFEYGANKYAAWNWAKGMPWSVPLGCIGRHWLAMLSGDKLDDESKREHWGHIVCNILMLAHYFKYYPEGDDRPPSHLFSAPQAPVDDPWEGDDFRPPSWINLSPFKGAD